MRVVDSFLFSEPYEADLLHLKLLLESALVDEWIILENTYTFQGTFKGLHAQALLDGDERFTEYRDRITLITADREIAPVNPVAGIEHSEIGTFEAQWWQRDLALEYVRESCSPEDWIVVSDLDESIDATDVRRRALIQRRMRESEGLLHLPIRRYWFDFDNEYGPLYGLPMAQIGFLQSSDQSLSGLRRGFHGNIQQSWPIVVAFEYSSCFPAAEIDRKLRSVAHPGFTSDDLRQALRCNHRPISSNRGMKLERNERFMLRTVVLDEENSPRYVRDHLQALKIHNIDPCYETNRRSDYPELYRPTYAIRQSMRLGARYLRKKLVFAGRRLRGIASGPGSP